MFDTLNYIVDEKENVIPFAVWPGDTHEKFQDDVKNLEKANPGMKFEAVRESSDTVVVKIAD